jgi:membrane protein DedA with SNARE-associated domain
VILWAVGVSLLGYFLASQIDLIDTILSRFGWGLLALIVLFFGGRFVYRKWIKKDTGSSTDSSGSKGSSGTSPKSKTGSRS